MASIRCFGLCAAVTLLPMGGAFAQGCANPIPITVAGTFAGSTCGGSNYLPAVANGAVAARGNQVIYALPDFSASLLNEYVQLDASANSASVYVCRNPCSTYSSCVAAGDVDASGSVTVQLGKPAEYFIVVQAQLAPSGICGNYTLSVGGTFNH